jgi:hypothetical protein
MKVNQEHAVTNFPFVLCLIPWRGDKAGNTFHTATVPSWQTATNMSCGAQVDHSTASGILQVRVVALVSMVILPRLYVLITAASQSATFIDRKIAVNLNMVQCINDDLGYI